MGDHLGSTTVVIDHDTGELVEKATYQPYGQVESDYRPPRWDSLREDVRYTGHWDDAQVGLVYFGNRYYAPQLGRWMSPDPLAIHGVQGDLNPYAFVHGSPARSVDPAGLGVADDDTVVGDPSDPGPTPGTGDSYSDYTPAPVPNFCDGYSCGGGVAAPTVGVAETTGMPVTPVGPAPSPADGSAALPNATPSAAPGITASSVGEAFVSNLHLDDLLWLNPPTKVTYDWGKSVYTSAFDEEAAPATRGIAGVSAVVAIIPVAGAESHVASELAAEFARFGEVAGTARIAAPGVASSSSYVYQLVDQSGEAVYYGLSNNPAVRLGQHAALPPGPFSGMQVISEALPLPQAQALETSLIQGALAEGRLIYNIAESSVPKAAPLLEVPRTVAPLQTLLNPRLYPR